MNIRILLLFLLVFAFQACKNSDKSGENKRNTEAREDSLKLAKAMAMQAKFSYKFNATVETEVVNAGKNDDSADDPAIWINEKNPEKSLILGTNKKEGLYAFDLSGRIKTIRKIGRVNNVDLRDHFQWKNTEVVLVAASNRDLNAISMFYIDKDSAFLSDTILNIPSKVNEVYGICMFHQPEKNEFYVIVNGKDGGFEQYLIFVENEQLNFKLTAQFKVNSQPEGIVADDSLKMLYLGVEEEGIFKLNLDSIQHNNQPVKIAQTDSSASHIAYDIEGLALFSYFGQRYLMASVQGNFSYAIYKLGKSEQYIGSFVITNGSLDGVEETDGLEVVNTSLLPNFPGGMIVVQDGFNYDQNVLQAQNFKYLPLNVLDAMLLQK
jgi:3-phytase